MRTLSLLALLFCVGMANAQKATVSGTLLDNTQSPVIYANVVLLTAMDSAMVKVVPTDEDGSFVITGIAPGDYLLQATYVGLNPLSTPVSIEDENTAMALGSLEMESDAVQLETATVTARRALLEVKADRTVFNVEGTINSSGQNAIELLRKAPGVLVDNNNNISVLSRSGVLVYVDGKRLPLTGDDLTNYLQNLPAEQIDRFDIITNPGARYEAEGNAGIIDIRLKKDTSIGANGSLSLNASQGQYFRTNGSLSGNYRNQKINVFGSAGSFGGENFNLMRFDNFQNGLSMKEINNWRTNNFGYNFRGGVDFFLSKNSTLGVLVGVRQNQDDSRLFNSIEIAQEASLTTDSILIANNSNDNERDQATYNINYRLAQGKRSLNIDLDYGRYRTESRRLQPNQYFSADRSQLLTEIVNYFDTPREIDIYTAKVDYETDLSGQTLGFGGKFSRVSSDNTFLFFDRIDGMDQRNDTRSNVFDYTENVTAGYVNLAGKLGQKWSYSAGLRAEVTDATGDLQAFRTDLEEPPVEFNYLSWFPSAGLTYSIDPKNVLTLNYGRRINRPQYEVLNPFNNQSSQLSFQKGNPFLQPEIVNNIELGYTLAYRYNFKLAYSKTLDQITRLIGPSAEDARANFITWENLATQTVYSMNISAPIQITPKWNGYFNFNASRIDNQADYGDGAIVDVQAWSYNIYQQQTFELPKGYTAELSGYFAGPGVWGGVFLYETSWALNVGLQKKFWQDKLSVRLSAQDIFYESGWDGFSEFNGLTATGSGRWDSRRASISLGYKFGNQEIKSRNRKTGLESEGSRVGG
ncbi:MAG: TonB-dependent receptor family protein [Saprospiraceae bacterium]|nr:TonB-dependent receptor family protein [Saprospiraceae bacterium]